LNPDLLMEAKDNSIEKESRRSRPDYNHPGTLRLSDRYTNSRGRRDLVEHDNSATRAPVLQANEELARTSRTSTELQDEYKVYITTTSSVWSSTDSDSSTMCTWIQAQVCNQT
jgi:hypothetical protein